LAEGAAAALLQPTLKTWMPACAGMTEWPCAGMTAVVAARE
jgi:type IV secretory pathway TrbD component